MIMPFREVYDPGNWHASQRNGAWKFEWPRSFPNGPAIGRQRFRI